MSSRPPNWPLGPWYPGALHGGAPAALIMHAVDAHPGPDGLRVARITYEFVRPVPQHELTVAVEVVRPGRRVTLLDATLRDGEGVEVTRARALLVRPSEVGAGPASAATVSGPRGRRPQRLGGPAPADVRHRRRWRSASSRGSSREPGEATAWFRLRHPLIHGRPVQPLERVAAAGDFGNGIAAVLDWDAYMFINPDLTLYVERPPVDEWVALESETRVEAGSVGVAESVMWDRRGRIGHAIQSLVIGPRATAAAGYLSRKALMRTSYCCASRA